MCRAVLSSLVLLASSACAIPIPMHGDTVWIEPKTVASKEEPSRLIASDGSICHTSPERYARVSIGEEVWCHWSDL